MAETLSIPAHGFGPQVQTRNHAPDPGSLSLILLVAFILQLFSNAALLLPALSALRPAQTIGGLALVVLICQSLARHKLEFVSPDGFLLLGFVIASGLSVFGAVWPAYAFESFLDLVKMVLMYVVILNTAGSQRSLRVVMWAMVLCGLFPAFGSLWNWFHEIRVEGRAAWLGLFANPNEMAYSLVILIPVAWALARRSLWTARVLLSLVVAVFLVAIYLSFSRGSLIGLAVVTFLLGLRLRGGLARAACIGLLLAGLLAGSAYWSRDVGFNNIEGDADVKERLTTYQVAWSMFSQSPLLGVGLNCSSVAWPLFAPTEGLSHHKWLITHNTFIQALSETGMMGGGSLLVFFAAVMYRAWKKSRSKTTPEGIRELADGLAISFLGFLVCGMSGGYVMSWFPYLLAGLIGALPSAGESAGESIGALSQ